MAISTGKGYIAVGKQTSKATAVTPNKFVKYDGADTIETTQRNWKFREGGDVRDIGSSLKQFQKYDGGFTFKARPDMSGFFVAAALGNATIAGSSSPWSHTVSGAETLPWLSVEKNINNQIIERLQDCKVNSFEISAEASQPVKCNVNLMGISASGRTQVLSDTYETDNPWIFYQGAFTIDGVPDNKIQKFSLRINNNLQEVFTDDICRNDILEGNRDIELDFTLVYNNQNKFNQIYYGGSAGVNPAEVVASGSFDVTLSYGAGSGVRSMRFVINKLVYVNSPVHLDPDIKVLTQDFVGFAQGASPITFTIQNATDSAY